MDQAAGDTRHEQVVVDDQLNDRVQRLLALLQHIIQLLSLHDSARETVQDETNGTRNTRRN